MLQVLLQKLKGDGLAARARRGSALTVAEFGSQNVLRLISNLILTRLLFPEAFGMMALVQVVVGALTMLSDVGIRASLVQHERGDEPDFVNTAWTLQVIRGVILSGITVLLAPLAASFYDEPQLAHLLPVAGLTAVVAGFRPTRAVTANRHLTLGRVTLLSICNQMFTILMTVLLAWWLQSVWALVFGMLLGGIQRNITLRMFLPGIKNRFRLEPTAVRQLISFGKFVFISTFSTFLVRNMDRALLGKFLTLDALGIYVIALTLATIPYVLAQALAQRIVFPLYARRKPHENEANRSKLARARYAMTGFLFFGAFLLVIVGDPLVRFLYDARYAEAGAITILIVIGILPPVITVSYDAVLLSNGRSDLHALNTVILAVLRVGLLYWGIQSYGVAGAALAPAVSALLHYPISVYFIRPYNVWDPVHDAFFALVSLGIVALAWAAFSDVIKSIVI